MPRPYIRPFLAIPAGGIVEVVLPVEAVERRIIITYTPSLECSQDKIWSFGCLPMETAANAQFLIKAAQALEQLATMEDGPFGLSNPDGPTSDELCARREASVDTAPALVRESGR